MIEVDFAQGSPRVFSLSSGVGVAVDEMKTFRKIVKTCLC